MSRVTVVVVAYGAEAWLERSVAACLASDGVDVDVVLVDNGCTDGAVDRLEATPGVTVLRPGTNTGFAGGCNAGVAVATGEVVALVNPDALVEPAALAALAAVATDPAVGIATSCVRLADRPELVNSAGNEVHFTGTSWSGGYEDPVTEHAVARDVLAASGAGCAMRRSSWLELGGFDEAFFAYYEDAQLSVRCWQRGLAVRYVPGAVVTHRYEISRHPGKYLLLERNRAQLVLTCFGGRTLLLLAPVLVPYELAVLAMAAVQGWLPQKLRAMGWIVRHGADLRRRRRVVQAARTASDRTYAHLVAEHLSPGNYPPPPWMAPFDAAFRGWWLLVRRFL